MWAAVNDGDAKKVIEVLRQDPGFDVNMAQNVHGWTLLHHACRVGERSAVIPLLLAHPGVDVNVKDKDGRTSFYWACCRSASCIRELLKDSRVNVNEPDTHGSTPLWRAVLWSRIDVIKWWIASGREMDLGTPGDIDKTDAIGAAKKWRKTDVATLLERFKSDAAQTRHVLRVELGWYDDLATKVFALVVFVSDGLLQIKDTTTTTPAARFFNITRRLPLELQMMLCFRQVGSYKEIIPGKGSEVAFKSLAKRLMWSSIFTG